MAELPSCRVAVHMRPFSWRYVARAEYIIFILIGHCTGSTREAAEKDINLDYVTIVDADLQQFWER